MAYITLSTAASLTGLSKRTLWRRIADGQIHAQGNADQGEHTRIPFEEILPLSRISLEADDQTLIMLADMGEAEAQCDLALLFLTQKHPGEAVHWLTLSAKQHYPEAIHQLGRCYLSGDGIEANDTQGIELITRAAALGHTTSKHMAAYLLDPTRETLSPAALESKLDSIEKKVVLSVLRETAHPA